jgi:hypothetical protein
MCFWMPINVARGGSRGISELFSLADWIDVFDNMIFDFADRARFLNSFVWHYTVTGADEKKLAEFKKEVVKSPPRQGGVQVTNENVKIEASTPDLKGADMSEGSRMVKLYGMGGAGLPAWFFADPVDANRSTAQEMEGPTGKKLTEWQNNIKRALRGMVEFAIENAIAHGVLPEGTDTTWTLQAPDLSTKDLGAAATMIGSLIGSLMTLADRGWLREETAARGAYMALTQIGLEVEPGDEFNQAQKEKQSNDATQIDALDPQANLAQALKDAQAAGAVQ